MEKKYIPVIGLEMHIQLLTDSKAFSGSGAAYGQLPNTLTDPVSLGHPGTLPVLNEKVVEFAVKLGLATNCKIREYSTFSRKNYFYPDLTKGYQISQYDDPICYDGEITIELGEGEFKKIGITRIHMEEDTGKSIHDMDIDTLIDFNRAGVPLLEIVTEPDIASAQEAYSYLTQLKQIVEYLMISKGNMEEAALRCDANVSVMPVGAKEFGTKTEVKNLNSFRNVEKAIEYEIQRQIALIESGGKVTQQTMSWDAATGTTSVMRKKESAHDYRYFPDPDLPGVLVEKAFIENLKSNQPELPLQRKIRFSEEYGIPLYDANLMVEERELADFYESACSLLDKKDKKNYKAVSNWIMTDILRLKSEKNLKMSQLNVKPGLISEIVNMVSGGTISSNQAKSVFSEAMVTGKSPLEIAKKKGLEQISDESEIEKIVDDVLDKNPETIEKYKSGRTNVLGFLVGQVMQKSKGKANPKLANDILNRKINLK
ncbi:MAG: Asp-tRNA(Asn)/Glu-tRNA(Gln) amidotransferase subunit GatB [Candidatus Kapaibacteriales bacterium]